jgi:2-aminoadipate transaminase
MAVSRPDHSILLGSFSKFIAPGLRLGWICAPLELIDRFVVAKQSVDLHSENLGQRVIHQLVTSDFLVPHLRSIQDAYRKQCDAMIHAIEADFPAGTTCTHPDGGMFLWVTLPPGLSTTKLFDAAIARGVAFVPGQAFHVHGNGENAMRLNFSNCDQQRIEHGMGRLAAAIDATAGCSAAPRQRQT